VTVVLPDDPIARDEIHQVLGFRVDVFPSVEACGHPNITLNGQTLPVKAHGEVLAGRGPFTTNDNRKIDASWKINCITVNGKPDAQLFKFRIERIEGRKMIDIGFSTLFRQTGDTEIIQINTDLLIPDLVAANPNPEALVPTNAAANTPKNFHQDLRDLEWLMAQMHELKFLISEKQQSIAEHASEHFKDDVKDCDSLKCVISTVARIAKHAAHDVYDKITGEREFEHRPVGHDRPEEQHDRPHHFPPHHHRNGTFPRKPHHLIPICRMPHHHRPPPPPFGPPHRGPPHEPPHHKPPPFGYTSQKPPFPPPPFVHGQEPSYNGQELDMLPPRPPTFPALQGPPPTRIFVFVIIGFVAAFLLAALNQRVCTPKRKADRKARREARREYRRSIHKNTISRLLARIAGSDDFSDHYEEKRTALLSDMEDGLSTTIGEEIVQLLNAADVVDDMVCYEKGQTPEHRNTIPEISNYAQARPLTIQTQSAFALAHSYNLASPGIYDQLPAYEDNDESDMDGMVSDGIRYTPGSSQYTPSNSDNGSVGDIIRIDTKY